MECLVIDLDFVIQISHKKDKFYTVYTQLISIILITIIFNSHLNLHGNTVYLCLIIGFMVNFQEDLILM